MTGPRVVPEPVELASLAVFTAVCLAAGLAGGFLALAIRKLLTG